MVISRFCENIIMILNSMSVYTFTCLHTHQMMGTETNLSLDYIKTRTYQTIIMYKSNNANSLLKLTFGKV